MEGNNLFAIEIDTENYADAAASDIPSLPRTFQSEEAFQLQKSSYKAKIDNGNIHQELIRTIPILADNDREVGGEKFQLSKKEVQLLGYAVAEMYYERKFEEILMLVGRVEEVVEGEGEGERGGGAGGGGGGVGGKLGESLVRWRRRCEARIEERRRGEGQGGDG